MAVHVISTHMKRAALSDELKGVAKNVAWADHQYKNASLSQRAIERVKWLGERVSWADAVRPAAYPLAWGLETGRASTEFEAKLVALKPAEFVKIARDIAAMGANVYDTWDAWKRDVMAA